jgi:polyferredoxin
MAAGSRSPEKKKRRGKRPGGVWITARKIVQAVSLGVMVVLFVLSQRGGWPASWVSTPMRMDPLLILMQFLASHTWLAGSSLALITLLLTLLFGRAWCGWICPLGTVIDLVPTQGRRRPAGEAHSAWRTVKYDLLLAALVAALLGNLTLLFLDPLTIFFRTLTVSIWPALNQVFTLLEQLLFQVPFLAAPISNLDQMVRPVLLPANPLYYRDTLLFAGIFLAVLALDFITPRFYCRYLCPLGGLLGLISKLAIFQRRPVEECRGCTLCADVCPTGTIDPERSYRSDPGECTMCLNCLEICPKGRTRFTPRIAPASWEAYDPDRRQTLLAIGSAVAGVALFQSDLLAKRESPFLIRPPGVRETNPDVVALTKCTRCSECMRACPTGAIQPATLEAGLEGFGTPILILRAGFCDFSCNACGQVCPVQAIPPLSLAEKRTRVIGKAYIDQNHCIPWSDHQPCIVCREMCPLPVKAVQVQSQQVAGPDGTLITLELPSVERELCIGCGLCEYQCPAAGEAAIRVYNPLMGGVF